MTHKESSFMYKIIGADGKEYGPISIETMRQWIAEGRVNGGTLVQPLGATHWTPAGTVPELAALWSAAATPGTKPPVTVAPVRADPPDDYAVRTSEWIGAGWELVKAQTGLLVGATAVVLLIQGVAGAVPLVGGIAGIILGGPLLGGLYWLNLRLLRGERAEFADVFAGFHRGFAPLMLVNIIVFLVMVVAVMLPFFVLGYSIALWEEQPSIAVPLVVGGGVLALAGFGVGLYWTVSWAFAPQLVVDRQMDFWPAMQLSARQVRKHWWGVSGFFLQAGLLNLVGLLFCLVGIFFTAPMVFAAIARAYEELFGSRPAPAA